MKTGKELLINDKFFENTVINKGKGEEIYNKEQGHRTVQDILRQLADLLYENKPDSNFE